MNINPPVTKFSEPEEIRAWVEELDERPQEERKATDEKASKLQRHLNDARTWLEWDLHGEVVEGGRDVTEVLEEVGALGREPGDPPPSES